MKKVYKFFTSALLIIFILTFVSLAISNPLEASDVYEKSKPAKVVGWYLVWSDEFDGDSLDESKWRAEDAALVKNNELQYYTPSDVRVHDGVLTLRSQERAMGGRQYTSGLVETVGKFSQKYGRFEVRAKLPKTKGMWPAHWMMPKTRKWPPEIDIMEMVGHNPYTVYGTLHWGVWPNNRRSGGKYPGPDFSEDFHTFAIEWELDEIRWYVDGKKYFSINEHIPKEPFYIILNTAVGGDWPGRPNKKTVFPQYHDIDYVRVYAREIKDSYYLAIFAKNGYVRVLPKEVIYKLNSTVELQAIPSIGHKFNHWSGDLSDSENPIKITMNKHKKIKANFVIDPSAPMLISNGKFAKSSSNENEELLASNAVDGNLDTRWSSKFSSPQWICIDLGKVYLIEAVRLNWEPAYARSYEIQISDDAVNWETVYSTEKGKGNIEEITNLNTSGRYVRMYGKMKATGWGYSLREFEVFGKSKKQLVLR